MDFPSDLKYTKEHEWVRLDGETATVGITDHAQDSLGDVVYVELPEQGAAVTKGDAFGVVESVKAVSDLYAPLSGDVVEVNDAIVDSPEVINEDPYGEGWMIKVTAADLGDLDELLAPDEYEKFVEEES